MTETDTQQQENKLIAERRAKLDAIRSTALSSQSSAFPNQLTREHLAADLQTQYGEETKEALAALDKKVSVAGRIMAKRGPFMVLHDVSGSIQLYMDKKTQQAIKATTGLWDIGDIVNVTRDLQGWSAKEFRVLSMKIHSGGTISLELAEFESSVYDWAVSVETDPPENTNLLNPL